MAIIDKFLEFEEKNNLFEQKIDGVLYWHYLRFILYNEIVNQKDKTGRAHADFKDLSGVTKAVRFFKLIYGAIFRNPFWFVSQKDVLVMNHARRGKVEGYYEALYTDRLLEVLPYSYTVLENPYQGYHLKPVRTKNLRYKDYIDIAQEFIKNIYYVPFRRHVIKATDFDSLKDVLRGLEDAFDVDLPVAVWVKKLQNIIWNYRIHKKYFKKIIKRVNPKIILEVVSYSVNRGVMNELAAERGIPTVELQHGTMGDGHVAYNFLGSPDIPSFPDYVFLFGDFWKETTRFPIASENVIVTGSPYFEERLAYYLEKEDVSVNKETILFISQGTIGLELSQKAVELSEMINPANQRIVYKLHPGEYSGWEKRYSSLASSAVEVVSAAGPGLYDLFRDADYIVGVYSTAILEGIVLCPRVFIFKLFGHEYLHQLYENEYAKLVDSVDEIVEVISGKNSFKITQDVGEKFWAMNSGKNMVEAIDEIIKMT